MITPTGLLEIQRQYRTPHEQIRYPSVRWPVVPAQVLTVEKVFFLSNSSPFLQCYPVAQQNTFTWNKWAKFWFLLTLVAECFRTWRWRRWQTRVGLQVCAASRQTLAVSTVCNFYDIPSDERFPFARWHKQCAETSPAKRDRARDAECKKEIVFFLSLGRWPINFYTDRCFL